MTGPARSSAALSLLLMLACAPPCPDTYPLCIETTDAGCRAWPAGCCQGIVACAKGTTFAEDAGVCQSIEVPSDKRVLCQ